MVHSFQWFMEIFQIAKMTTKHNQTVLSKLTTCEHLDKGSSKSEIACEYKKLFLSISCIFV